MIDKREMQYLYHDGTDYVFMDNETYDQLNVAAASLGDAANYLVERPPRSCRCTATRSSASTCRPRSS